MKNVHESMHERATSPINQQPKLFMITSAIRCGSEMSTFKGLNGQESCCNKLVCLRHGSTQNEVIDIVIIALLVQT